MFSKFNMNNLAPSTFFLLVSTFLAGVPESGARGGKGAKGAGGGVSGYGHRGLYNSAAYEMTWEDIVLAMQLSAMCFGALLALCIVACCAYKICGPAEEEDWARRYRTTFKPVSKLTPEMLKEVYTLPATATALPTSQEKNDTHQTPTSPTIVNTTLHKHSLSESSILGTAVTAETPHQQQQHQQYLHQQQQQQYQQQQQQQQQQHQQQQQYQQIQYQQMQYQQQQQRPLPPPPNLPNGRAIMEESARGGGCLSLGGVLDHHRPRGVTLSSLSTSRLLTEARRPGVAPRLAAHLNNSTLDLTHPPAVFMPTLNASSRSLSEPQTAVV